MIDYDLNVKSQDKKRDTELRRANVHFMWTKLESCISFQMMELQWIDRLNDWIAISLTKWLVSNNINKIKCFMY